LHTANGILYLTNFKVFIQTNLLLIRLE